MGGRKNGVQKGAQSHAEGQHGPKTQSHISKQSRGSGEHQVETSGPHHNPAEIRAHDTSGKDRLFEDREQHDEADMNSEKTRLARDIDRHNHGPHDEWDDLSREARAKRKS